MPIFNINLFCLILLLLVLVTNSFKIIKESPIEFNKDTLYNSQVNIETYLVTLHPLESSLFATGPEHIGEIPQNEQVKVAVRKKNKLRSFHFKATETPRNRNKKFGRLSLPYLLASDDYPISNHSANDEVVTAPPNLYYAAHTPQYAFNMYNPAYRRDPPISPKLKTGDIVKSKRQYDTLEYSSQIRMPKHFVEGVANSEEQSANRFKNSDVDMESIEIKDININDSVADHIPLESAITASRPDDEVKLGAKEMPSSYHVKEIFGKNMFLNYDDIVDDVKLLASTFSNISALIEKQNKEDSITLATKIDYPTTETIDSFNVSLESNYSKQVNRSVNNTKISDEMKNQSNICLIQSPASKENSGNANSTEIEKTDDNTTQASVYREVLIRNMLTHHKEGISNKIKSMLDKLNERSHGDETSKLVVSNETIDLKIPPRPKYPNLEPSRWNKRPMWKEFSFMGLYIHEPSHLYCDAAAITPHWLIASGVCLNKHIRQDVTDTRSAYVAYCGPNWSHPGRVAYVKYSLQHPRFQPNDPSRSHLYNIGLIRVAHSMDKACNDWTAVQLMSYKFTTDKDGVTAQAIGWGLDRYSVKDGYRNLPAWPLLMYEGIVHSECCPGNTEYQKLKQLTGVTENMYCLALPTYLGDQRDPAHGSFLISSGKIFAVYLKEDRKSWGDQSAVYTGIWKILPWIAKMAQEPEDPDLVMLEV